MIDMNRRVRISLFITAIGVGVTLGFQNCGGFKAIAPHLQPDGSSSTSLVGGDVNPAFAPVSAGDFSPMNGSTLGLQGRAILLRGLNGKTQLTTVLTGLTPSTAYSSHVHLLSCAAGAGGHFMVDSKSNDTTSKNGLWPSLMSDATGAAMGAAEMDGIAGAAAASVVIHAGPNNDKVACADLLPWAATTDYGGRINYWNGPTANFGVGFATLLRNQNGISSLRYAFAPFDYDAGVVLTVSLTPVDCTTQKSLLFTSKTPLPVATPGVDVTATGMNGVVFGAMDFDAKVTASAVSMLVTEKLTGRHYLCADLKDPLNLVPVDEALGGIGSKTIGSMLNAGVFVGHASLMRNPDFSSTLSLTANVPVPPGGAPMYMAHIHNRSCRAGAGGHYQIDPSLAVGQTNEIWLSLMPDQTGLISTTLNIPAILRADALSLVIHDPTTSKKLLCADL